MPPTPFTPHRPLEPRSNPAATRARLLTTLVELQAERDKLVASLIPFLPPSAPDSPDPASAAVHPSAAPSTIDATPTSPTVLGSNPRKRPLSPSPIDITSPASTTPHHPPATHNQIQATMSLAKQTQKAHIQLLHGYNEIKDVAQGLMGLVAEQRGVRVVEVMGECGVDASD